MPCCLYLSSEVPLVLIPSKYLLLIPLIQMTPMNHLFLLLLTLSIINVRPLERSHKWQVLYIYYQLMRLCRGVCKRIKIIKWWEDVEESPLGRYSCIAQGASPGWINETHLLSPKGATLLRRKTNTRSVSAAPTELDIFSFVYTQGFSSGFALISPWALQGRRAYGTHNAPEFWCSCLVW